MALILLHCSPYSLSVLCTVEFFLVPPVVCLIPQKAAKLQLIGVSNKHDRTPASEDILHHAGLFSASLVAARGDLWGLRSCCCLEAPFTVRGSLQCHYCSCDVLLAVSSISADWGCAASGACQDQLPSALQSSSNWWHIVISRPKLSAPVCSPLSVHDEDLMVNKTGLVSKHPVWLLQLPASIHLLFIRLNKVNVYFLTRSWDDGVVSL